MTWQEEFKMIVFAVTLAFALIIGMKALTHTAQLLAHDVDHAVEQNAG